MLASANKAGSNRWSFPTARLLSFSFACYYHFLLSHCDYGVRGGPPLSIVHPAVAAAAGIQIGESPGEPATVDDSELPCGPPPGDPLRSIER
jgi:hypothetical protein